GQSAFAQESRIKEFALIAVPVVGQNRHDAMAGTQFPREPDRARDIDPAGAAKAKPFLDGEVEDDLQRLVVGDLVGMIDLDPAEVGGDAALADAFGDGAALGLEFAMLVVVIK